MTETELRHLIGQRLAVGFEGTSIPEEYAALVHDWKIGNVILFRRNIESFEQIRHLNQELRELIAQETGLEPYIMLDEECGSVSRLGAIAVTTPCAMAIGATEKPENAFRIARIIGQELRAAGFNLNLAPVLDVCTKPDSANGNRIFSSSPEEVAEFGKAYIRGLSCEGIFATGKHFPGHGDTNVDSHFSLPVVQKDRKSIEQTELVSFKAAIDSGIHAIMSAHVVYPALDPACVPATVSRPILTTLLRDQLGFKGLLLSDGMEMKAVMDLYGIEDAVWRALCAGVDICLVCHSPQQARDTCTYLLSQLKQNPEWIADLQKHAGHIASLKKDLQPPQGGLEQFGSPQQKDTAEHVMETSVRILHAPGDLPLPAPGKETVFFGTPGSRSIGAYDGETLHAASILAKHYGGRFMTPEEAVQTSPSLAVAVLSRHSDLANVLDALSLLLEKGCRVIAVAMSAPQPLSSVSDACWHVCTWQYDAMAIRALIRVLDSGAELS
ncbi:MAG: beta-N-acetylhexosaminidase [Clostridiales bacterium]|nr:beta-N-acetylhexosaminidase [Clostridiales bacterium]